jgi:peptidoglycan lytic transglycosylase G
MKKFFYLILTLLVAAGLGYLFLRIQWGPHGKGGLVYIPKGSSVGQIAQELRKAGFIPNPWSFKILVRLDHAERELKPGEYEFPPQVEAPQILDKLRRGERVVHKLAIPEGYTFKQIAYAIAQTGIADEAQVLATFQDPKYLNLLGFPAISLEGYLFPSTYEYDSHTTLQDLLTQMIRGFQENFGKYLGARAAAAGWTIPQVVTLASIVEKETGRAEERPLIASVFENRLRTGMLLQSDPTIIYGLPHYDGNIHPEDIHNPHPYNTYVHPGLPPGPIASPGMASLQAVLFPTTGDYLYFVARGDGTHQFSKDLASHHQAVQRYQLATGPAAAKATPETVPGAEDSAHRPLMKTAPVKKN